MDLRKLTQDENIPLIVTAYFDVNLLVKGYHKNKSIWTPKIGEIVSTEKGNLVNKCVFIKGKKIK